MNARMLPVLPAGKWKLESAMIPSLPNVIETRVDLVVLAVLPVQQGRLHTQLGLLLVTATPDDSAEPGGDAPVAAATAAPPAPVAAGDHHFLGPDW